MRRTVVPVLGFALLLLIPTVVSIPPPDPVPPPAVLPACTGADPVAAQLAAAGLVPFEEDPQAADWSLWYLDPSASAVPVPPRLGSPVSALELAELHALAAARTPEQEAAIRRWDEGPASRPWEELTLQRIQVASLSPAQNPPRIARSLAILEIAIHDALVATWRAKECHQRPAPSTVDPVLQPLAAPRSVPSYPSEHAAVAGAASEVLAALIPGADYAALAREAAESRLWAGANWRSDVEVGLELGRAAARAALAARADDGSDAVWDGTGRITGTCNWSPTPPAFSPNPLEPAWGRVRPFVLASGDALRPPPPPPCDGPDYQAQVADLYHASRDLTDRQRAIARYWAGGPGTETPPGMNLHVALNESAAHGLTTMRHARVLMCVAVALADASIAAWDAKFAYWGDRPVTAIRRTLDPTWTSLIGTPPFPGYVSGHSTFSGAASEVLAGFFPEDAVVLRSLATEAAMSRYYGGIHIRADNEVGLTLGAGIAAAVLARDALDGPR